MSKKINQSNYFLSQMEEKEIEGDKEGFYYVYSAFLSSSRSVLQYIETHRKNFYKRNIKNVTLKEKFRVERNIDIHVEPSESLNVGTSYITVSIEVVNPEKPAIASSSTPSGQNITGNVYQFYFKNESDLINNNRIVEMAKVYMSQIEQLKDKINS